MAEKFYLILAIVFAVILLCGVIAGLQKNSTEKLFANYLTKARADGLTTREAINELSIRQADVRIRRVVSEAVMIDPARYESALEKAILHEMETLKLSGGPGVARRFSRWIAEHDPSDFLTPEAYKKLSDYRDFAFSLRPKPENSDRAVADLRAALGGRKGE